MTIKLHRFRDKMPEIGSNIILFDGNRHIAIETFTINMKKSIEFYLENDCIPQDDYVIDWFTDDPEAYENWDVCETEFWAYISSIKASRRVNVDEN